MRTAKRSRSRHIKVTIGYDGFKALVGLLRQHPHENKELLKALNPQALENMLRSGQYARHVEADIVYMLSLIRGYKVKGGYLRLTTKGDIKIPEDQTKEHYFKIRARELALDPWQVWEVA